MEEQIREEEVEERGRQKQAISCGERGSEE